MLTNVDLSLRANQFHEHRRHGVVPVEHDGVSLAPHEDIRCRIAGRDVAAHITAIACDGEHVPHVYADEVDVNELVS